MNSYILLSKLIVAVLLGSVGQVCFKIGSASFKGNFFEHLLLFITNKFLFIGLVLYGISTIIYVTTLQKIDLSLAYPVISISYVFVVLLAYFFLGESLSMYKVLGIMLITIGVGVLWIK
ncbi:MAG: putative membrane protein [Candidatus Deianiraeaceae bacterium]|jgi:uncharacterized membrane protein